MGSQLILQRLRFSLLLCLTLLPIKGYAIDWFPFGPDGGDARAFGADPRDHNHLYLGTANGWIYDTHNGGQSWQRLARVGKRDDLVLDSIIVDPSDSKRIIVGTWVLGSTDGGLFISIDAGATWSNIKDMDHQSILALAMAPSDSKTLVAGTLKGVFRSTDGGQRWSLISPAGSTEIHEVESIAIDPGNPQIIYAGTWHLPWKTTDGGANWHNIKQGIIEDSDVFSIIVDPKQPQTVYASACSGIYKSDNGGEKFAKIQGIPSTARRTRVLMQDPLRLSTVFAGTTEGLYRTDDSGSHWMQATSADNIVNDVYVDPTNSKRVMMAIDRGGVLASNDGGVSFAPSNVGFSSRQVTAMISDIHRPAEIFIGVVNDKVWGGAFYSANGGLTWQQRAEGLDGHDVLSLGEAANGTFVAGTERGLYGYDPKQFSWQPAGNIVVAASHAPAREKETPAPTTHGKRPAPASHRATAPAVRATGTRIESAVLALTRIDEELCAITAEGMYSTTDPAKGWQRVTTLAPDSWRYLASAQSIAVASSLKSMAISVDSGRTWKSIVTPSGLSQIGSVAVDDTGEIWVGGREGLFLSTDNGASFAPFDRIRTSDVNSLFFDSRGSRLVLTGNGASTIAYSIHLPDKSVKHWETGWNMRFLRPVGENLIGATMFDGMVLQPVMVQSK
ncbi:photosystem II stability/assembly factor-like uncharacterized protein [Granulicella aggregans]|uniref:Photosystem II stability/assembly factor-like uncharacterized protein n=1 Tax=Granulicella aggregans TaxID=474949 RepID=A0A7W7ZFS7_9BACT|nr:hypothetical protein [Granulicella aggregans]MBB5059063.1 photosystem II stability/assembly factor-like uncharacterized protein [Granulicella aggregans]